MLETDELKCIVARSPLLPLSLGRAGDKKVLSSASQPNTGIAPATVISVGDITQR